MNSSLWIDKYRPKKIDAIKTHQNIIDTLYRMKESGCMTNLLCYGPSGCGKTTTMLAFGNDIYKHTAKMNIMKINASDERGISTIRQKIDTFIQTQSLFPLNDPNVPYKMILLDEADYMTNDAQYAIINIMDQYPDVLFVFICNYIYKMHESIQSRCLTMYFSSIPKHSIQDIIMNIKKSEGMHISDDAIKVLCNLTNNDMRSVMYILQSLHCSNKHITPTNIYKYHQYPTDNHILRIIEHSQMGMHDCYDYVNNTIKEHGLTLNHIINRLYDRVLGIKEIPEDVLDKFIIHFADLEHNLTHDISREIVIGSLVAGMWLVKEYLE